MKAIMISDKPKWCSLMMNGKKNIEVRTSKALAIAIRKLIDENGYADIYVYCSKDNREDFFKNLSFKYNPYHFTNKPQNKKWYEGLKHIQILNGKVLFKFRCYKLEELKTCERHSAELIDQSCLSAEEFYDYLTKGRNFLGQVLGYAIHISDLEIFDKPKELWEFEKVGSYNNPTIKCKKKEQGRCNYGKSPFTGKWVGCEKARLTKAPQNFCYVEVE